MTSRTYISDEMIGEAVTVPNKSYNMNDLSTYKVTLTNDVPPRSGLSEDRASRGMVLP
jgi:hypothetical protein